MNEWVSILALLLAAVAVAMLLYERWKIRKIYHTLEAMLQSAMQGSFSETQFDESKLSRIETEFAHYLNASDVSARAVVREKNNIETMIADISHQTKTPIANLLLYSELLQESDLTGDQKESTEAIHQQTQKLRFLIDSLVKLSRLENGIIRLSPRQNAITSVLQDVYEEMLPKAGRKGISLVLEPTDAAAVFDAKWTNEALCNIVDNAIKYTDAGTVRILAAEYELFTRIDIADTGIGIPEEEQPKIFGRFYRSKKTSEMEGVGIGLYLAREIISAENGYIKVKSAPGEGSVFSVFLPRP